MITNLSRVVAAAVLAGSAGIVTACEVEDWRWYSVADYLTVEGATTCNSGKIIIRLYEGEGEGAKFLGVANAYIEGFTFEAIAQGVAPPQSVSIKYSILPGG